MEHIGNEMKEEKKSKRINSIDALRGFDMFWISSGEDIFRSLFILIGIPFFSVTLNEQLEHVPWIGFHFYDLIFPLFLFIAGVSMPFALNNRLVRGESKQSIYIHIIKRTLMLYLLGMVYNGLLDFDFQHLRYTGVLHRIAFAYFVASFILMNTKIKGQVIWTAALLLGYWAIITFVPVPGFGACNLTPEGNLCAYLDRRFLPGAFCCYTYGDNEGLLSMIPAISTALLGILCGHWLRSGKSQRKIVTGIFAASAVLLLIGWLWSFDFPIIKNMWTSSFVLVAGGFSLMLLGLFYWIIDVKGYIRWAFPFIVIGLNPITIYVLQGIFDFAIIAKMVIHGFVNHLGSFAPLVTAITIFGVKWLFLYFLYKKKIFLKV